MKNLIIFLFACLLANPGHSQHKKFKDIIGHWAFTGENQGASLEIIDSSTIILNYMGQKRKITDCKIDFAKTPIWFDFSTQDSSSVVQVKSLMVIMGEDVIKWQLFIDEERPSYFSSTKGELFYLKKTTTVSPAVVSN